jgi:transposase InsO family protein
MASRIISNAFSARAGQYHAGHRCVTYIDNYEGWLYLSAVPDLYSNIVVGWSMSHRQTRGLDIEVILMAL